MQRCRVCSQQTNQPFALSFKVITGLGLILALMASAPSASAGVGSAISPAIAIDTASPEINLGPIDENAVFFSFQTVRFYWTSFDHNPGTGTEYFQASIIIESEVVDTITWYPRITKFIWDYTMPTIQSGNCYLEVVAIDSFGNRTTITSSQFSILLSTSGVPDSPAGIALGAPIPNPFNPATTVNFSAPAGSQISLSVYDARGRLVRNLAEGPSSEGTIAARWDGLDNGGRPQPGGVYMFVLDAQTKDGPMRLTRKAMLVP